MVIADTLARIGLADLPYRSHDAEFTPEGTRLVWTSRGAQCDLCGRPCKRFDLDEVREDLPVAYIGDGVSDRCVCGAADVVFARAELADWLAESGRPFTPFADFGDVRTRLGRIAEVHV